MNFMAFINVTTRSGTTARVNVAAISAYGGSNGGLTNLSLLDPDPNPLIVVESPEEIDRMIRAALGSAVVYV